MMLVMSDKKWHNNSITNGYSGGGEEVANICRA
jgi:hypothetical protein